MMAVQSKTAAGLVLMGLIGAGAICPAKAQVIPDGSLGPERSQVFSSAQPGSVTHVIEGGAVRGDLLFHSFEQFSVPVETEVVFQNDLAIRSILSRVTGSEISTLEGTLMAQGEADLFLINPHGILIGPEAQLNIGGSFIATTAETVTFSEGGAFSAVDPQGVPLLTVDRPVGLQFGAEPAAIGIQGSESFSLQVLPNQSLALVGGDVTMDQGELLAPGGRIELGSVAPGAEVNLEPAGAGWRLIYDETDLGGTVEISGATQVNASGEAGGGIQLGGEQVRVLEDSEIISDTQGEGAGQGILLWGGELVELRGDNTAILAASRGGGDASGVQIVAPRVSLRDGAFISTPAQDQGRGGDIEVLASESLEMSGISSDGRFPTQIGTQVFPSGSGAAGSIRVETPVLRVADGGQISASTFGAGQAGQLTVIADQILLEGTTPDGQVSSGLFSQVNPEATGAGGQLEIETGELILLGGAQVSTSNRTGPQGGSLTITARERVLISGSSETADLIRGSSGLFVSAEVGSTGSGGDLLLTTPELIVEQGGKISADTFGPGQGGTAILQVDRLKVRDGGSIRAGTFAEGEGGALIVQASESVEVSGSGVIGTDPSNQVDSALFTQSEGAGEAGDLQIVTGQLQVKDGGEITVSGTDTGNAGQVLITATEILLDNGRIQGETAAGGQGDLVLNAGAIQLRQGSRLSTDAGGEATGGNISITADTLVGLENSDISANALEGSGGQIEITATGVFGLRVLSRQDLEDELGEDLSDFDPSLIPTNDIVAISQTDPSLSGEVIVNTPDVDPSEELVLISEALIDVGDLVATTCNPGSLQSTFLVLGRGGIAASPVGIQERSLVWLDLRPLDQPVPIGKDQRLEQTPGQNQIPAQTPGTEWVSQPALIIACRD